MDTSAGFVFRLLVIVGLSLLGLTATLSGSVVALQHVTPAYSMQDLGDSDNDGLPNSSDVDDDNDGMEDALDPEPFNPEVRELAPPAEEVEEPAVAPTPEPTATSPSSAAPDVPDALVEEPAVIPTPEPTATLPPSAAPDVPDSLPEPSPTDTEAIVQEAQAAPVVVNSLPDTGTGPGAELTTSALLFFTAMGISVTLLMGIGRRSRTR